LIFAPLAVAEQTEREGVKFGIQVTVCGRQEDCKDGINITNYEKMQHFDPGEFSGIVLDESSILKSFDGVTRKNLGVFAKDISYRLAATATPAPNDFTELCNHAEWLGIMQEKEVKALFFTQDGNTTTKWRLKGHAEKLFWKWLASWSVACRMPSDYGYENDGFVLPPLQIVEAVVNNDKPSEGFLFPMEAITLEERRAARRSSIGDRVKAVVDLVAEHPGDQWLIWCDLNSESELLKKSIACSVEVKGSDSSEHKKLSLLDFSLGKIKVLISKPSICGHGMNFQNCCRMAFVGLSDSYEQFYQAIRRCWRFGQKQTVTAHIITSSLEGQVVNNIKRKEKQAGEMMDSLIKEMIHYVNLELKAEREEMTYREEESTGKNWKLYLGDCVKTIDRIESESIGLAVFSPPFPGMYTYTNSPYDMGNTRDFEEMLSHFSFLVEKDKLWRVMLPGRSCCIHLTQGIAKKGYDGYIGLKDFRGRVISMMEAAGWVYYGEVAIEKDPQVKAIRTKDQGLLFKTLSKDSSKMHMALADYLIQFRKPGDNPNPIKAGISDRYGNTAGWITDEEWIEWASPIWYRRREGVPGGIRETDVLNVSVAREESDERHLCPLQLGVIERAVKLWSAPGEIVLSPFAGIGSEGYMALKLGRKFIGIELKESYWLQAQKYLALASSEQTDILSLIED